MSQTPKLVLLSENLRGKSFELTKDIISIGRREPCDVVIKDSTLSSHHCEFIRSGDTYRVRDNDSTNGTRVNNVQLKPGEDVELKNFDVVQLGGVETLFECEDAGGSTVTNRTKTGIELDHTDAGLSTVTLNNYSPFANEEKKLRERNKKLMWISLISVGVLLIVLAAVLLASMSNMG